MTARLSSVTLAGGDGRALPPEIDQERKVAVFDLLEENSFALTNAPDGPYRLDLGLKGGTLIFDVTTEAGKPAGRFDLSLGPLRQIAKDYRQICESYYAAVTSKPAAEIEALDEARRAIHGEGAQTLRGRLEPHAAVDIETAKKLFTLLNVLMCVD